MNEPAMKRTGFGYNFLENFSRFSGMSAIAGGIILWHQKFDLNAVFSIKVHLIPPTLFAGLYLLMKGILSFLFRKYASLCEQETINMEEIPKSMIYLTMASHWFRDAAVLLMVHYFYMILTKIETESAKEILYFMGNGALFYSVCKLFITFSDFFQKNEKNT